VQKEGREKRRKERTGRKEEGKERGEADIAISR
jgi:hypothetical protein